MLMKKLVAGSATSVIALALAATAHAQSTATQAQEVIVTGTRTPQSAAGLAAQVNDAKDESIVGKQFIATQLPSSNVAQLINLLPGVSWSTEEPAGLGAGDLRIHGFDGAHIAFILDGAPLNDTGNYAVYPGEYMIGELIDHITVNIGSSDVDSPSASALGATINVVSKVPTQDFGAEAKVSGGSYGYYRGFGEIDTGAVGPFGTKAWFAAEHAEETNYANRPGHDTRDDVSGRIYQPLKGTDFISVSGIYVQERLFNPYDLSASAIKADGAYFLGDNYSWVPETVTPGKADTPANGANVGPAGGDYEFYKLYPNPVNFASIRGQSKFTLAPGLTFTFDPSFFYTIANGGGATNLSESSALLKGNPNIAPTNAHACVSKGVVTGVDLNGDGDCMDTLVAYDPSNTETYRYGLTTSLLYDLNEQNHFQVAYTLDYGLHRQTGEYSLANLQSGDPGNVFSAKSDDTTPIVDADGNVVQKRNRRSVAILNQISGNYIGKFLDDKLHINIGIRAPFFYRELNNYCATYNGTTVNCGYLNTAALQTAYNTDLAADRAPGAKAAALSTAFGSTINTGANGVPDFLLPFTKHTVNYSKPLPNVGVSYRLAENNLFYVSYAGGFAAPKTDDLYSAPIDAVKPETSDNFAAGYRYQTHVLNLSGSVYDTEYHNHIVTTIDPNDPTSSIDRNVGDARIYGLDLEAGLKPIEHLNIYASANFNHSELLSNYESATGGVPFAVPAKGKELVLTPERTFALRASYDFGPITVGAEEKYISRRYITDTNDLSIGGYGVTNIDARYNLPFFNGKSYVQLNVQNLFDRFYYSRATTTSFAAYQPTGFGALTNTNYYYIGAPSFFSLTLNAQF
jgi:iron complex outermembrane receptor protein